jgi:frataxin-like iron-binding protein CyaY
MRRRRRGSPAPAVVTRSSSQAHDYDSDDDDNDEDEVVSASRGLLHKTVDDPVAFLKGADTLLDKIQEAMEPMKRANDYFFITRGTEEDMGDFLLIDLGPLLGQYTLQIALDERCLLFQSPISGQFTYKLSENKGEWCGEDDGHAFEGLLVRDLIRQVNGIPNL